MNIRTTGEAKKIRWTYDAQRTGLHAARVFWAPSRRELTTTTAPQTAEGRLYTMKRQGLQTGECKCEAIKSYPRDDGCAFINTEGRMTMQTHTALLHNNGLIYRFLMVTNIPRWNYKWTHRWAARSDCVVVAVIVWEKKNGPIHSVVCRYCNNSHLQTQQI